MIQVKIIGAGGFGGVGISRLLLGHSEANIVALVDPKNAGKPISSIYPHLTGFLDMPFIDIADSSAMQAVDVVFMATPDGVGMKLAMDEIEKGAKIIDYSGDFRFNSKESYAEYAQRIGRDPHHTAPDLLSESVYGLTELHRKEITSTTKVVGNPGCFAVSCILGLAPVVKEGLIDIRSIICDCKTGVSGAGKKPNSAFHYPLRYDHMNAYKLSGHQHVCEIERELSLLNGNDIKITFTAHVFPLCRGIMSTLYGNLAGDMSELDVVNIYESFYKNDKFIRIYGSLADVGSMHVRGTNYCNIVISVDKKMNRLRVVSYIDNLVKGQAGSALQNMNVMFGLPESMGLDISGAYP